MNRLVRWPKQIGLFFTRLIILFWGITKSTVAFLPRAVWRLVRELILEELVWRRWLGYGERPFNVLAAIGLILVVTWILYWQVGTFVLDSSLTPPQIGQPSWPDALYYSLVSFSALGYGTWAPQPTGWAQWVGAVQPFVGIVSAVALSINLTQRMSR